MNPKFLRALRELRANRAIWLVVHHPMRHEVRRIRVEPISSITELPKGSVVLVSRGGARESMPPWVAEVRGFALLPDRLGLEHLLVTGPSGAPPRWVGRSDVLGVQVEDRPYVRIPCSTD